MKSLIFIIALTLSALTFSQEKKETDSLNSKGLGYVVIEQVPVYKGCDSTMTNESLRNCMATAISKHVARHYNTKIVNGLGLPDGPTRINVIFKINQEGNIIDIRSRAQHPILEEEATRVIKLIPQMEKPGYQRGKPVIVPYSLPIIFNVQNPKRVAKPRK